ncbi:MAG: hypothetical protein IT158_19895 [Bryobacterales bacterium]|nr:hypothetical protein [Bryobacterales bacterium]
MRPLPRDRMSARRRIEASLRGERPDRVPIFDLIQNIPLIEQVTGKSLTLENSLELLLETIGQRLDITRGVAAFNPDATLRHDDGFVYKQEWWTTWLVERPFDDVPGLLAYIARNIREVLNRKPGDMWTFAGRGNVWGLSGKPAREQFLELQAGAGDNVVLFPSESPVGLDTAYIRSGLELFVCAYAEAPRLVSEWLEALNWAEIQRVHETADAALSPVALVYSDIAGKNGPFFSPRFLRTEFFPRLARLVEAWHTRGIHVIYHSDGNLWPVLQDLARAGIDGINPLEPLSGMHVGRVHRAFPHWILMGGIDASRLLAFGTPEEVRQAVREAIDQAGRTGRLWLGSSTEIHPGIRPENALAMWDEIERCGYSA